MTKFLKTYSYKDKRVLLSHLEGKGHKKPKNWKKISSEVCGADEMNFDVKGLLKDLAVKKGYSLDDKGKFAIDVVSNPNEVSRLDKGEFKVRYRYDLAFDKRGQKKIQDNTREFCAELISRNLLFRREDIDIMSFRGSNPLAKQRYSIFRLKGHWNCRHAWIREVFVQIRDEEEVENNPIFGKPLALKENKNINLEIMSKNERIKLAIGAFSKQMEGQPLTKNDIVLVNEMLLGKQKFLDVNVDDKILRIDADEVTEGAGVNWIDEAGELMEVEDGQYSLVDEGKVITVTAGVISAIEDIIEEAAEEEAEETELKQDGVEEKFNALNEKHTALEAAIEKLTATIEGKFTEVEKKIEEIPAFDKEEVKSNFAEDKKENKKRVSIATPFNRN